MVRPLLLSVAFCLVLQASAVVVYRQNDPGLLGRICAGQPTGARLCHPFDSRKYVACTKNQGAEASCDKGLLYDYETRNCQPSANATICPRWRCPTSLAGEANVTLGSGPISKPYGTFGTPGNITLTFPKAGLYSVYCPISGHCAAGMNFVVSVNGTAPKGKDKAIKVKKFMMPQKNSALTPKKFKDVKMRIGDKLVIDWIEPFHIVAVYDMTGSARVPIVPYPPQPMYKCPEWKLTKPNTTVKGETRHFTTTTPSWTWTANATETRYFVDPFSNHCRLGKVFKATVAKPPDSYKPQSYTINWAFTTFDNYPDMLLYIGDKLTFKSSPPEPAWLSSFKEMKTYEYPK